MTEYNATVLRNKGMRIELYRLDENGEVDRDDQGQPRVEKAWVRFDANAVAEMEDRWDGFVTRKTMVIDGRPQVVEEIHNGIAGYDAASAAKPQKTLRDALAIALKRDPAEVGAAMISDRQTEYMAAVAVGWQMANGIPAEAAGKVLTATMAEAKKAMAKAVEELEAEMEKLMSEQDATPGADGSPPGPNLSSPEDSDADSTSSGS